MTPESTNHRQAGLFEPDNLNVSIANESLLSDYRQRYGLSEDPFSNDPGFPLFTGGGRRQLLDQLLHLCQFSHNLLVVTGEPGVGKTRIAHALADSLEENDQLCFLELSPDQSLAQLLSDIAEFFQLEISSDSADVLLAEIENFIHQELDDSEDEDGLILIIIDNAEQLDSPSIAALGSLIESNLESNSLHIVLVGEPRLVSRLNGLESEALPISDFHLPAFNLTETVDYLNFRMEMADYLGPEIFTESIVDPWWRQAHGQLNIIHEYAQDKLLQSMIPESATSRSGLPIFHILAISGVIGIASVFYLYLDDEKPVKSISTLVSASTHSVAQSSKSMAITTTQAPVESILPSLPEKSVEVQISSAPSQEIYVDNTVVEENLAAKIEMPISVEASETSARSSVDETIRNNPPAASNNLSRLAEPRPARSINEADNFSVSEQTILTWVPKNFTIQLVGVSTLKAAQKYVDTQSNKQDLLIFKSKRAGKDWFVVVTGHFESNSAARLAISQLPAKQRDAGPWPRQVSVIQKEIRENNY